MHLPRGSRTPVSALILLALWGMVRIQRRPDAAAIAPLKRGSLAGAWAAYALGSAGALEVLNVAIPWLAVANAAILHNLDWAPPATLERLRSTIAAVYLFRVSDVTTFALLPTPASVFAVVPPLLALVGAWRLRTDRGLVALLVLAVLGMPLALLASAAVHALLIPRSLIRARDRSTSSQGSP